MRPHISAHAVANEVRMLRTLHKGSLLIVEGATDKRTFRSLTDENACRIVISHGKENALTAMQVLEGDQFEGVLAIVDADFNRPENTQLSSPNILLTDLHDIECMMIASPAFAKVVGEFADPERIKRLENAVGCSLAELLATNAMPLGYLRWISLRERLDLRFEKLSFHKFIDRETLNVNVGKLVQAVKDHSQRPEVSNSSLEECLAREADVKHDPWQVCCGHDLLEILSLALRFTVAGRNAHEVKREILERDLRLAYQDTYFQQSKLVHLIREWEDANESYRVLPRP